MNRYLRQELENKLLSMNGADFQELCDSMLYHIYHRSLLIYNCVGQQLGKSKTKAGTPDTFILLDGNIVVFVEATTKSERIIAKLLGDISACLDKNKINLGYQNINKIILCYNNRIDVETELNIQAAVDENVVIEHYGIDRIVETILHDQPWLAENLGINVNKPGVYSLDKFIERYNNFGLTYTSPLNTKLISRERELTEMESHLNINDYLLVNGESGVGKTRLVVEFLRRYFECNRNSNVIVLDERASQIETTVLPMLSNDKVCVFFIDDVNRKTTILEELLQVKNSYGGKIKVVLTIRDYACKEFTKNHPLIADHIYNVISLSDDCITEILESSPYGIKNQDFKERIESISKGNLRLAIMCAELAIQENGFCKLVKDVPSLYDTYFSKHIAEIGDNEYNVLSACAIFRCLKQGEPATKLILDFCKIDDATFNTTVSRLESNECIEIWRYDDGKAIKIIDQIFATYLVYDSVFRKQIYSLSKILDIFFHSHKHVITDTIGGVLTAYRSTNVGDIISESVNRYAKKVKSNNDLFKEAIETFGFFMPEEALCYYDSYVSTLPQNEAYEFSTDDNLSNFINYNDNIITQLIQYFNHEDNISNLAFDILYKYCECCPEKLPELVHWIKKDVIYNLKDYRRGSPKLHNFLRYLFDCLTIYKCCLPLFFNISKSLLEYRFSKDCIRGNKFVLSQYSLCKDDNVVSIRKMVIEKLAFLNYKYHTQVIDVLYTFKRCNENCSLDLAKSDIEAIYSILPNIIEPCCFRDILVANHLRDIVGSICGKYDPKYKNLTNKYTTDKFLRFNVLNNNKVNGKCIYNPREWVEAKKSELAEYYLLNNELDVSNFIEELIEFSRYWENDYVYHNLLLITQINVANNINIGKYVFDKIIINFHDVIIKSNIQLLFINTYNIGQYDQWLESVIRYNGDYKYYLLYRCCNTLTNENITTIDKKMCNYMKLALKNLDYEISICLENLIEFGDTLEFISIIRNHNNESPIKISICTDGFCSKEAFGNDIREAVATYKQQKVIYNHFDFDKTILKWLYEWQPESLLEILDILKSNCINDISFVFKIKYNYEFVKTIFEKLLHREHIYNEPDIKLLFMGINDETSKEHAIDFVQKYIKENIKYNDCISYVIDACLCIDRDFHDDVLLNYFNNVPDERSIEEFNFWPGSTIAYSGDITYGDICEQRWKDILSVALKIDNLRRKNRIVKFIKDNIAKAKGYSNRERGDRFMREI